MEKIAITTDFCIFSTKQVQKCLWLDTFWVTFQDECRQLIYFLLKNIIFVDRKSDGRTDEHFFTINMKREVTKTTLLHDERERKKNVHDSIYLCTMEFLLASRFGSQKVA